MKICIFLLYFMIIFSISRKNDDQQFSGKIIYNQSYESRNPDIPTDVLTNYMGDQHEYYYSKGNYKSIVNSFRGIVNLYLVDDEKLYYYPKTQDSISVIDLSHEKEKILKYEINKKVVKVLDRWCDELILFTDKSTIKYYFDGNLKIKSELFKNHIYSHWNLYTKLAESLPLKYVMEFEEFVVIGEATEIKEYEINDDFFALPK